MGPGLSGESAIVCGASSGIGLKVAAEGVRVTPRRTENPSRPRGHSVGSRPPSSVMAVPVT